MGSFGERTQRRKQEETADELDGTAILPDNTCPPAYNRVAQYDLCKKAGLVNGGYVEKEQWEGER